MTITSGPSSSSSGPSATASRRTRRNRLLDSRDHDRQRDGQAPHVVRAARGPRLARDDRDLQDRAPDLGPRVRGRSARVTDEREERTPADPDPPAAVAASEATTGAQPTQARSAPTPEEAQAAAAAREATEQATRTEGSARVAEVHQIAAETDVRRLEEEVA